MDVKLIKPRRLEEEQKKEKEKEKTHPTLRFATLEDVPRLLEIGAELYSGSPIEMIGYDRKKVREGLETAIIDTRKFLALVSTKKTGDTEEIVGALVAYHFLPIFSNNRVACELLLWLDPEHRRGRRGLDLMEGYEHWARLMGCTVVQYGFLANSPPKMETLYERTGAVFAEKMFFKRID